MGSIQKERRATLYMSSGVFSGTATNALVPGSVLLAFEPVSFY